MKKTLFFIILVAVASCPNLYAKKRVVDLETKGCAEKYLKLAEQLITKNDVMINNDTDAAGRYKISLFCSASATDVMSFSAYLFDSDKEGVVSVRSVSNLPGGGSCTGDLLMNDVVTERFSDLVYLMVEDLLVRQGYNIYIFPRDAGDSYLAFLKSDSYPNFLKDIDGHQSTGSFDRMYEYDGFKFYTKETSEKVHRKAEKYSNMIELRLIRTSEK